MRKAKKKRLEAAGWKVGSADEFLGLSEAESELIELKVALARHLKLRRQRCGLTQTQLAKQIKSSQPRVAKLEAADPSVSVDLLVKSLLTLGVTRREIARVIGSREQERAA